MTTHRKRIASKAMSIAAIVAILAVALVGTTFAINIFGFRDLIIPRSDQIFTFGNFQGTEEQFKAMSPDGTLNDFTIPMSELLLAGFTGSPEYEAAMEWLEWQNRDIFYVNGIGDVRWDEDTDAFVHAETGEFVAKGIMIVENQETLDNLPPEELEDYMVIMCTRNDIPEAYQWYWASSWADVEMIHDIIERHGLILYGELFDYFNDNKSWEEFQTSIANKPFIDNADNSFTLYPGYRWESGTFHFDARHGDMWFAFRSGRKGTFDPVAITNIDISAFSDEWVYENIHGIRLILVQGTHQSFILADTETAFISVSVHTGTNSRTRSDLERFADLIDFGQLK